MAWRWNVLVSSWRALEQRRESHWNNLVAINSLTRVTRNYGLIRIAQTDELKVKYVKAMKQHWYFAAFSPGKRRGELFYLFWPRYSKWKLPYRNWTGYKINSFWRKNFQGILAITCFDWLPSDKSRLVCEVGFQICICFLTPSLVRNSQSLHVRYLYLFIVLIYWIVWSNLPSRVPKSNRALLKNKKINWLD